MWIQDWMKRIWYRNSNGNDDKSEPDYDEPKEYRRGDLVVKKKHVVRQLITDDEMARSVYDGLETRIKQFTNLTAAIKRKKIDCVTQPKEEKV